MAGFTQLNYHQDMTERIVKEYKERLKNPYWLFSSKKQTICTYYNQNVVETTFDPGLLTRYSDLGDQSPNRFNKIRNCFLYGISSGDLNASYGDWGLEASEISGECFNLPDTFTPYPNDYFSVNYLDKDILFKIISVTPETLPNGTSFYKMEYKLDQHDNEEGDIEKLVVRSVVMNIKNFGTTKKVILEEEEAKYEEDTDIAISNLKDLYRDIFYDSKVQTFCFQEDNGANFYDPYLIEFMIRNDILKDNGPGYIYLKHSTILSKYFNLEYNHSMFKAIETGRIDLCRNQNQKFCAIAIEEPTSLMSQHYEIYYQMTYSRYQKLSTVADYTIFDIDLIDHILKNQLYKENEKLIYNIIINYFNGQTIDMNEVNKAIECMDFINNKETFYIVPIVIFILDKSLSKSLTNTDT